MKIAVTGHRQLFGRWDPPTDLLDRLRKEVSRTLEALIVGGPVVAVGRDAESEIEFRERLYSESLAISGMALGADMLFAEEAIRLGIPLHAAIPCCGQELRWPLHSKRRYHHILEHAASRHTLTDHYSFSCMQDRNEYMVDMCDHLIAIWDGTRRGGTWNCLCYAIQTWYPGGGREDLSNFPRITHIDPNTLI